MQNTGNLDPFSGFGLSLHMLSGSGQGVSGAGVRRQRLKNRQKPTLGGMESDCAFDTTEKRCLHRVKAPSRTRNIIDLGWIIL